MRRAVVGIAAGALLLTGCASGDPRDQRLRDVEALVAAANDRDPDAVQQAVEDLLSTIREQVANNEVEREEGERLRAIALRIVEASPLLDPSPSPEPPSPQPEPEEPSPEPTEDEPEPSPEPTEDEEEEPEDEEEPEPSPIVEVPVGESPTPAQVTQPAPARPSAQPSSAPQPTPAPTA